jgi:predicted nucleotidyltransferase
MRLKKYEIEAIENTFLKKFIHGEVYLFGSRVDDNQKGGDIDLYIKTKSSSKL